MSTRSLATACTLILLCSMPSFAAKLNTTETRFMTKAAQGGLAEVSMGRLAEKQASNSEVKQFGTRMVKDHTKVNDQLMALAKNKGVTLPKDTDAEHMARERELSKMKGVQFDHSYMQFMVSDHQKDVTLFQKAAKESKDADVKRFASGTLPTLQEHLRLAKDIVSREKSTKKGAAKSKTSR